MVAQRYVFQATLFVLVVCCAALGSQEGNQAPKAETNPAQSSRQLVSEAGCPLSEDIATREGLSHKRGSVFQTLSPQKLFSCLSPSVMAVESLDAKGSVISFGSGVVIGSDHVITNRHVTEEGVSFRVEHGGKEWSAKLIRVAADHDLAELSVPELPANAAPVIARDSSTLSIGERVYAIGAPEGLELTISEGLISGLRDFGKERVIQTSAAISPGSSGGGLFDAQGRLIGITTFYLKEGQDLNFALPAEWTVALDQQPIKASPTTKSSPAFRAMVWFVIGLKASQEGKYNSAVSAYRKALDLNPRSFEGWFLLGEAYSELHQTEKAVDAYRQAIRINPNEESTWVRIGTAYGLLRKPEKELSAAQESVRLEPSAPGAWFVLGLALRDNNDQSGVIKVYKKLKALDPKMAESFFRLIVLP